MLFINASGLFEFAGNITSGIPASTTIFVGITILGVKVAPSQYKYSPSLNIFSIFLLISTLFLPVFVENASTHLCSKPA